MIEKRGWKRQMVKERRWEEVRNLGKSSRSSVELDEFLDEKIKQFSLKI